MIESRAAKWLSRQREELVATPYRPKAVRRVNPPKPGGGFRPLGIPTIIASCIRLRPEHRDHVWSYDFVEDRTHDGRKVRMLNVVDEFTRECLAIRVARKLKAVDVIDVLSDLFMPHAACRAMFVPTTSYVGKAMGCLANRSLPTSLRSRREGRQ